MLRLARFRALSIAQHSRCANGAAGRNRRRLPSGPLARVSQLGLFELSGLLAATFSVVFQSEGDLIALIEGADARRLKRGCMDKHVLRAVLGGDEAKALWRR
jgi:hypothetical protein